MASPLDAPEILNRTYLEVRAKLLEIGASLDRLERAEGDVEKDPRRARIQQALRVLEGRQPDRAEQIQLLFSLPYEDDWQETLAISRPRAAENGQRHEKRTQH